MSKRQIALSEVRRIAACDVFLERYGPEAIAGRVCFVLILRMDIAWITLSAITNGAPVERELNFHFMDYADAYDVLRDLARVLNINNSELTDFEQAPTGVLIVVDKIGINIYYPYESG